MRRSLPLVVPLVIVLACSVPGRPVKAEPLFDDQQIISRLTDDIWPAVTAYNLSPTQVSPGAIAFRGIVDPGLRSPNEVQAYDELRDAVQKLGRQGEYDPDTQTTHSNDGMEIRRADVASVQGGATVVSLCYTYIDSSYGDIHNPQKSPGASEASVELVAVNGVWYLHAITDDRTVSGCADTNG